MPRFDRYILRQLLGSFGFFALVLVGVYWINRAVGLFDQIIGSGQTAMVFLKISALALPNVIRLLLPVAAFAASVQATNRLMGDSELVVMQATGFSPFRLSRPVLVFGLIVVAMLLVLSNFLVPMARIEADRQSASISEDITARFLQEGQFTHPSAGVTLFVREVSAKGELLDMFLSDDRRADRRTVYTASRSLLLRGDSGPKLLMFNGMVQRIDATGQRLAVTRFEDFTYDLGALLTKTNPSKLNPDGVGTAALLAAAPDLVEATGKPRAELVYAGHSRLAGPFIALVTALLGFASLMQGTYSRTGMWQQIALAVLMLVALQGVITLVESRGPGLEGGHLLAYVPPILGLVVALALLARASGRRRRPRGAVAATVAPA